MTALLAAVLLFTLAACELPAPPQSAIVYGDSQTKQAKTELEAAGMVVRANGGEALCDWFDQMRLDALTHPRVVVLALNGNWRANPCVYSRLPGYDATIPPEQHDVGKYADQLTAIYLADLKEAKGLFDAGTLVYGVTPAPLQLDDRTWALKAFRESGLPLIDVRSQFVDANGRYADPLPDEAGRLVKMRADDGRHFTTQGAERYAKVIESTVCTLSRFSCGRTPQGPEWKP